MNHRVLALFLLSAAMPCGAQSAVDWHVDAEFTLAQKGAKSVRVAVTVLDERKIPVESLAAANFRLERFFCDSASWNCSLVKIPIVRGAQHLGDGLYFVAFEGEEGDPPIKSFRTRSMLLTVSLPTKRGPMAQPQLKGRAFVAAFIPKP